MPRRLEGHEVRGAQSLQYRLAFLVTGTEFLAHLPRPVRIHRTRQVAGLFFCQAPQPVVPWWSGPSPSARPCPAVVGLIEEMGKLTRREPAIEHAANRSVAPLALGRDMPTSEVALHGAKP